VRVPRESLLAAPVLRRFLAKVRRDPHPRGCWLWHRANHPFGYGQFSVAHAVAIGAHVASYAIHVGDVPDGMMVCHHCDTPLCVNPEHLFLGTHTDNVRDAAKKGRLSLQEKGRIQRARGSRHSQAKLTEADVLQIRRDRARGVPIRVLAIRYGCSGTCITYVETRRNWAHVKEESAQ
jgi:hypothetical protein